MGAFASGWNSPFDNLVYDEAAAISATLMRRLTAVEMANLTSADQSAIDWLSLHGTRLNHPSVRLGWARFLLMNRPTRTDLPLLTELVDQAVRDLEDEQRVTDIDARVIAEMLADRFLRETAREGLDLEFALSELPGTECTAVVGAAINRKHAAEAETIVLHAADQEPLDADRYRSFIDRQARGWVKVDNRYNHELIELLQLTDRFHRVDDALYLALPWVALHPDQLGWAAACRDTGQDPGHVATAVDLQGAGERLLDDLVTAVATLD